MQETTITSLLTFIILVFSLRYDYPKYTLNLDLLLIWSELGKPTYGDKTAIVFKVLNSDWSHGCKCAAISWIAKNCEQM